MVQQQRSRQTLRRRTFRAAGITLLSVFSLLLWSRLKMVTDTPRMVYADPRAEVIGGGEREPADQAVDEPRLTPEESERPESDTATTDPES